MHTSAEKIHVTLCTPPCFTCCCFSYNRKRLESAGADMRYKRYKRRAFQRRMRYLSAIILTFLNNVPGW